MRYSKRKIQLDCPRLERTIHIQLRRLIVWLIKPSAFAPTFSSLDWQANRADTLSLSSDEVWWGLMTPASSCQHLASSTPLSRCFWGVWNHKAGCLRDQLSLSEWNLYCPRRNLPGKGGAQQQYFKKKSTRTVHKALLLLIYKFQYRLTHIKLAWSVYLLTCMLLDEMERVMEREREHIITKLAWTHTVWVVLEVRMSYLCQLEILSCCLWLWRLEEKQYVVPFPLPNPSAARCFFTEMPCCDGPVSVCLCLCRCVCVCLASSWGTYDGLCVASQDPADTHDSRTDR